MTDVLVDQSNVLYRAYYSGIKVDAIHPWMGVVRYFNLLRNCAYRVNSANKDKPRFIFAGESKRKLDRSIHDESYKTNRVSSTDERFQTFKEAINKIHQILDLPIVRRDGLEADDVIASAVQNAAEESRQNQHQQVILSNDKDLRQLLMFRHTIIYEPPGRFYSWHMFKEEYGFEPDRFVFYKALVGDRTDDVSGVSGWGPVKATEHIQKGDWMLVLKENNQTEEYWHAMELVRLRFHQDLKPKSCTFTLDEKKLQRITKVATALYEERAASDIIIALFQLEENL